RSAIATLSLHDALPIFLLQRRAPFSLSWRFSDRFASGSSWRNALAFGGCRHGAASSTVHERPEATPLFVILISRFSLGWPSAQPDRKSTRLNSSHVANS